MVVEVPFSLVLGNAPYSKDWAFKQPGRKKYKLLFHNGSFKKKVVPLRKSIKVWYSKAQKKCKKSQYNCKKRAPKAFWEGGVCGLVWACDEGLRFELAVEHLGFRAFRV